MDSGELRRKLDDYGKSLQSEQRRNASKRWLVPDHSVNAQAWESLKKKLKYSQPPVETSNE